MSSIQSLLRFGTAFAARTETVLYPWTARCTLRACAYRCASTHFGENQLAPSSIGISPLTTAHPPIFQHRSVRSSTRCYPSFILAMVRSPGFGSLGSDTRPIQTRFRSGSGEKSLTKPLPRSRRLILQQARGQPWGPPTACKLTGSWSISLPGGGSFHRSLAVLIRYRSPRSI